MIQAATSTWLRQGGRAGFALLGCLAVFSMAANAGTVPAIEPPPVPARDLPTLDELLGLEPEPGNLPPGSAPREDLRAILEDEGPTEPLARAIGRMGKVAYRLAQDLDPGIGTQRLQRAILGDLDELIRAASAQQSSSSSSSSSTSPSGTPAPGQQPGESPGSASSRATGNEGGQAPPGSTLGNGPDLLMEELDREWGGLPRRIRDMLMQGRREAFSSVYEQMTREYYRRLAEGHPR